MFLSNPSRNKRPRARRMPRPTTRRETTKTSKPPMRTTRFNVTKRDGTVQLFSRPKLAQSIVRAGATKTQANQISRTVATQLSTQPKVTTQQVSNLTNQQLARINTTAAQQYITYKATSEKLALTAQTQTKTTKSKKDKKETEEQSTNPFQESTWSNGPVYFAGTSIGQVQGIGEKVYMRGNLPELTKVYNASIWCICDQTDDDNNKDELSVVIKADMVDTNLGHDFEINKGQERGVGGYDFKKLLTIALLEKDPKDGSWFAKPLNFIHNSLDELHNLLNMGLNKLDCMQEILDDLSPGYIFGYTAEQLQKKNYKPLGATYIHFSEAELASKTYQYKTINGERARYRIKYRIEERIQSS